MRQISFEEAEAVGGGDCSGLNVTVGFTGISVSGSGQSWSNCLGGLSDSVADAFWGYGSHLSTGIPYGAAHIA